MAYFQVAQRLVVHLIGFRPRNREHKQKNGKDIRRETGNKRKTGRAGSVEAAGLEPELDKTMSQEEAGEEEV